MALSTLVSLKTLLGVTGSSQDTLLQQLLDAADGAVKRYTKRDLELATYTEYQDGNGAQDLVLRQRPVVSITTVHEDPGGYYGDASGSFASSTLLTAGSDYVLVRDGPGGRGDSGLLRKLRASGLAWWPAAFGFPRGGTLTAGPRGPVWNAGFGSVKVVYQAGYSTIPADLVHAVNQLAAWLKVAAPKGGIIPTSESLGRYSYGLGQLAYSGLSSAPELGSTRGLLAPYREVVL